MVAGVTDCHTFVALMSEKYFTSYFCCLEMHTALRLKKRVLLVFNQSKFTVQMALGWIPEELAALKNNEVLPIHEDMQIMEACVKRMRQVPLRPYELPAPAAIGDHKFNGEASTASGVAGLEELLGSLGLGDNLAAADAWCVAQGAESVGDLNDEDYPEQLAKELALPPIKAKKLVKAIKGQ